MQSKVLGQTGLTVSPVVLGGNVFGWTIDECTSLSVLSAAFEAGITSIDTADMYSVWVDGHVGGESERVIGAWIARNRSLRDRLTLFTKVGADLGDGTGGLSRAWITKAVEDSLRRLNTDYIDLYFSHYPDTQTPHEETLSAYQALISAGKVRAIGASNYSLEQLQAAHDCEREGLPRYDVLQLEYNLHDRADYEQSIQGFALDNQIAVVSYFSLASGFLTGKYRDVADIQGHPRAEDLQRYFTPRGQRILAALLSVAQQRAVSQASVALAWLRQQPGISAPIASITSPAQLPMLVEAADLVLNADELALLNAAST